MRVIQFDFTIFNIRKIMDPNHELRPCEVLIQGPDPQGRFAPRRGLVADVSSEGAPMSRLILRENLRRYRRMLSAAGDSQMRRRLQTLVTDTERQLFFLERIWTWTCPYIAVPSAVGAAAENLLDKIVEAEGADLGSLQLWDPTTSALRLLAQNGFDREAVMRFAVMRDSVDWVCEAARSASPSVFVEDTRAGNRVDPFVAWSAPLGVRAIKSTPVLQGRRFLGVLSTHFRAPRIFAADSTEVSAWQARQFAELLVQIEDA